MAKLSHKINDTKEQDNKNPKIKIRLTTKNEENTPANQQEKILEKEHTYWTSEKFENIDSLTDFILNILKNSLEKKLSGNEFNFTFEQNQQTSKDKLKTLLNFFISKNDLDKINNFIQEKNDRLLALTEELEKLKSDLKKSEQRQKNLQTNLEATEEEVYKIKQSLKNVIPAELITKEFEKTDTKPQIEKISRILNENFDGNDKERTLFFVKFVGTWDILVRTLENMGNDEKENMEKIHSILTLILLNIKGLLPPERRTILDLTAEYVNEFFEQYVFISPEQSLQIDPNIHNAEGIGGSIITEGVSFAVVRKLTGKTVKFADIIAQ